MESLRAPKIYEWTLFIDIGRGTMSNGGVVSGHPSRRQHHGCHARSLARPALALAPRQTMHLLPRQAERRRDTN
jgi:hypothetical protein